VGARQGLFDLVAVHENVRPEQHGGAERHLLVPIEDLEELAPAGRFQRICNSSRRLASGRFFTRGRSRENATSTNRPSSANSASILHRVTRRFGKENRPVTGIFTFISEREKYRYVKALKHRRECRLKCRTAC